jgi:uncharacterized protein YqhQ
MSQHPPRNSQTDDSSAAAAGPPGAVHKVGGMAMGDGVVMRSRHFWALARSDGSLEHGAVSSLLERDRRLRLPVVRSLVALVEMTGFAIARHRSSGRRNRRLLACIGVYAAVGFALQWLLPAIDQSALLDNVLLQVAGVALSLLVIWLGMGPEVWRFHGAEHVAVNAYEDGADLDDVETVSRYSRIHDRCGTNLVAVILVLMLAYAPLYGDDLLSQVLAVLWSVAAVAIAFELFKLISRRPRSPFTRAVLLGGRLLQRAVTTRRPTEDQLRVACHALRTVTELESAHVAVEAEDAVRGGVGAGVAAPEPAAAP